jgi:hypothetical protein
MISNIINKEFCSPNDKFNLLWTSPESAYFTTFIKHSCSCSLIDFDKTYYGLNDISLVVCNNRLIYLEKCIDLAKFFHAPLLIVDHSNKSSLISNDFVIDINFEPIYQVATSKEIYLSWNKIQNAVIEYSGSKEHVDKWKNLLFQLIKSKFIIKEDIHENKK